MTLLAIDTSTSRGSVALWKEGAVVLDEVFTADRSHSSALFPILERALATAAELECVAVGLGPGSYAGVRIAISAALGISMARKCRLIGLASIAALETSAREYLAVGDARRDSFYFAHVHNGLCIEGPALLGEPDFAARLLADQHLPVFSPAPLRNVPQTQVALPRASILARLAAADCGILAETDLEPLYLREPHITVPKDRRPPGST